ncbi:MAG: alpha-2-macroglobulin family protein, partial [Gemmatimonadaceae bacterium]|nr:alpha-2-macroglobulin family protein [Gemmatimonadaceae bacterium]
MKDRLKALALLIACVGTLGVGRTAGAQDTLRVLDHLPREVARPGDIITITFDRPVAGSLEHMVEPSRIVRIDPAVHARMEWRDPSTIRVVPLEPLEPGRRYTFTVDTAFSAFDGSRLAAPERFTLGVRGPQFIGSVPYLAVGTVPATLDPTGRLLLGFSAPVADSVLNRTVRLTTQGNDRCATARTFAYHVVQQRAVRDSDPWELRYWAWTADSISRRFHRLVELKPDAPLPEDCAAVLTIPSFDSLDATTVRYEVETAPPFGLGELACQVDCEFAKSVTVNFSAPVAPQALLAGVRFEPAAAFSPEAPDEAMSHWTVAAKLTPRSTYRVFVDSSLRDIYGRRLTGGFVATLTVGDREPNVGYHAGLMLLPTRPVPTLRVRHVNVDSVMLRLMPVPEHDRASQLRYGPWWASDRRRPLPDTIVKMVALRAPFNEERVSEVPLPELTGRLAGRLVAVRMVVTKRRRAPDDWPTPPNAMAPFVVIATQDIAPPIAFLQATDLLVHARVSAGRVMAWVTSVRDGLPVKSAELMVFDTAGAVVTRGTTDERGVATLALPRPTTPIREDAGIYAGDWPPDDPLGTARLLEVRKGSDRSLVDLSGRSGAVLDSDELAETFDRGLAWGRETHATAFTDRGVFRPGERVHLGAVIREGPLGSLRMPPSGDSARVRMTRTARDGTTETLHESVQRISLFGTLTDSVALRPNIAPGYYRVRVELMRQGGWRAVESAGFLVAEYRAPEFLVTAQADSLPHVRGDSVTTLVRGTYLFGAPMAGIAVNWSAQFDELDSWDVRIPGIGREWTVGRQHTWWSPNDAEQRAELQGTDTLDAQGVVQLRIGTDSAKSERGATARIDVAVTDVNRQVVTASTRALVHAASFYIALRDSGRSWWWPVKASQRVQVIAVRPDGRRVAGVQVRLAVVRHRWSAPDTAEGGNWQRAWRADTVHVDTLVTADSALTFSLPALREGPLDVVASATDERGRQVVTTIGRYAYGAGGIAGGSPNRLPLRVEQARLAPGADAVVSFTSPWPTADAWVTVEREGVMSERVLRGVSGSVTLRLPMSEREIPNAFVSVLLVRRGRFGVTDAPADRLRVGHAALSVDDAAKRLDVRVRAVGSDHAPGDSATIELTVRDAQGRGTAAEATIWAVDEGVLSLTGFETPDLMQQLYAPVHDGVSLVSSLDLLRAAVPPWRLRLGTGISTRSSLAMNAAVAIGGAASSGMFTPRRHFNSTAFFRGGVVTDANGVARITVKLPDNITTFRLMAVAVSAHDQYGSAASPMLVTKPLIVRAAMPRFLRADDSVFAGGVINARDARPRRIDVTASGTGVRLTGDSTLRATLAATGTEARFAWRGIAGDTARVALRVTDGTLSDAVALALPIKPDQTPRSRTIAGTVRGTATVRFLLPRNLDAAKSRLTIRSGTSPVPTLRVARRFLLASSYSCPDQLTSAGRMLVSLLALERIGTRVLGDTLWARGQLQHIADELARRDRDGWVLCCWEDPWEGSPVRVAADLLLLD